MKIIKIVAVIELLSSILMGKWGNEIITNFTFPTFQEPSISISFLLKHADLLDVVVEDVVVSNKHPSISTHTYTFKLDENVFEVIELNTEIEMKSNGLVEIDDKVYFGLCYENYLIIVREIYNVESLIMNINKVNQYLEKAGLSKIRLIFE